MEFAGGANGSEPGPMELQMESRPTSERARGGVIAPLERHEVRWRITRPESPSTAIGIARKTAMHPRLFPMELQMKLDLLPTP